jgi:hypothetical protein
MSNSCAHLFCVFLITIFIFNTIIENKSGIMLLCMIMVL